jgi:hypothetical protein
MSVNGVELGPEEDGSLAGLEQAWGERQGNDGDIVGFPNQPGWNPPPGNGYGFFYDMRRGRTEGPWSGTWHLGDKGEVHLRMTLLGQDRTEVIWAKAPGLYPSNPKAGYFLARRRGEEPLASTYVAVLEPYDTQPFIHSVQALAMEFAEGQPTLAPAALQVVRTNGEVDYIISGGQDDGLRVARTEHGEMRLSGAFGRVHVVEGQPVRLSLIGGGELTFGDLSLHAAGSALPGKVLRVDPQQNLVYTDARLPAEGWLVGSTVYFSNPAYSRNTAYRIEEIEPTGEGTALHLGRQSVILGIGRVGSVKSETELLSDVPHEYARTRNVSGAFFEGKLVIGDSGGQSLIKSFHVGEPSTIEVQSTAAFRSGERLTYYDLQAGDDLAIPVVAELRRLPDGTYEAVADVDLQATAEGRSVVVRPLSVE